MDNRERAQTHFNLATDKTEMAEQETRGKFSLYHHAEIQTHLMWACVYLLSEILRLLGKREK